MGAAGKCLSSHYYEIPPVEIPPWLALILDCALRRVTVHLEEYVGACREQMVLLPN